VIQLTLSACEAAVGMDENRQRVLTLRDPDSRIVVVVPFDPFSASKIGAALAAGTLSAVDGQPAV